MDEGTLGDPLAAGRTAEVFAWGDGRVLKLLHEQWGADAAEHEAEVARAIYDAGAPAPQVYGVTEVTGRAGVIYERIDGPSLLRVLRTHPMRGFWVARVLAEAHAAMHARATEGLTLPGFPSLRQVLVARIRAAEPLPAAHREVALRALDALPDGTALCHGDYHPDNVLLSARGPLVIDWENVAAGDPLADVARTLLLLRASEVYARSPVSRTARRAVRSILIPCYLRRYRQLRPFDAARLAAWELPVTAARLCEGIAQEEAYLLGRVAYCVERFTSAPTHPH